MEHDKGGELSEWPKAFDALLDREMLFKIHNSKDNIDNGWQTYTVRNLSVDESLIDQFKQLHGLKDVDETEMAQPIAVEVADIIKDSSESVDGNNEFFTQNQNTEIVDVESNPEKTLLPRKLGSQYIGENSDLESPNNIAVTQTSSTKVSKFVQDGALNNSKASMKEYGTADVDTNALEKTTLNNNGKIIGEVVDLGSPSDGAGTRNAATKVPKLVKVKQEKFD